LRDDEKESSKKSLSRYGGARSGVDGD